MDFITLNEQQTKYNIDNLAKCLNIGDYKIIYNDVPEFTEANRTKYNLKLNINKTVIGSNYQLLEFEHFYFIIIYLNKFSKDAFQAAEWFNHMIDPKKLIDKKHPCIYILTPFILSSAQMGMIPNDLIKYNYRFVPLQELHPLIGSPRGLESLTLKYERLDTEEMAFNNKDFAIIYENDPAIKLVNAVEHELIRVLQLVGENSGVSIIPEIRRVHRYRETLNPVPESGLCLVENNEVFK